MAGRLCKVHSQWRFRMEIPNFTDLRWEKVSEIAMEVEVEEIYEGGALVSDKFPGRGKTEPVTLERGATNNLEDIDWFKEVADFESGTTADACGTFKKDIALVQLNGQGSEIMRHSMFQSWPHRSSLGEWDNSATDKVIRKVVLIYDYVRTVAGAVA